MKTPLQPWVKVDSQSATQGIDGLARLLRQIHPQTHVLPSLDHSNIWHIVCLPDGVPNPMTQTVSLSFTGRIGVSWGGILLPLHAKVPSVDAKRIAPAGASMDDMTSTAAISVTNKSVRDTLTLAVPLEGQDRILWHSVIERDGVARVEFLPGKRPASAAPKAVP